MFKNNFIMSGLIAMITCASVNSQVTIGADKAPESFSILELISNQKGGFRLPQMTTAQRDVMTTNAFRSNVLAKGLQIFNITTNCVDTWNGTQWISQCAAVSVADKFWMQGGNSWGAAGAIGTNDNYALNILTNGSTRATISADGKMGVGGSAAATENFDVVNGNVRVRTLNTNNGNLQAEKLVLVDATGVLKSQTMTAASIPMPAVFVLNSEQTVLENVYKGGFSFFPAGSITMQ
jgi:hypothetical protein